MKSDSQLCTLPPSLFFVNRWVEVSDCDDSQNGEKGSDRHIHTVRTVTHGLLLSVSSFSPTIIFTYDMITLRVLCKVIMN